MNEINKKKYIKSTTNHDFIQMNSSIVSRVKARACRNKRDAAIALRQIKLQESDGTATDTEIRHREEVWI